MNINQAEQDKLDDVRALRERVTQLLEDQDNDTVGAVMTDVFAQWIVQHVSDLGPRQTVQLHRRLLLIHTQTVEKLIRYYRER